MADHFATGTVEPTIPLTALMPERLQVLLEAGFDVHPETVGSPAAYLVTTGNLQDEDCETGEDIPWRKVFQDVCADTGIEEIVVHGALTCSQCCMNGIGGYVVRITATTVQEMTTFDVLEDFRADPALGAPRPSLQTIFELTDGEQMHRDHPETFWIPSDEDKARIQVGDNVKLVFNPLDGSGVGERMWVMVDRVGQDGTYSGTLNSVPAGLDADYGDPVEFEPRHIIQIMYEPTNDDDGVDNEPLDGTDQVEEEKLIRLAPFNESSQEFIDRLRKQFPRAAPGVLDLATDKQSEACERRQDAFSNAKVGDSHTGDEGPSGAKG